MEPAACDRIIEKAARPSGAAKGSVDVKKLFSLLLAVVLAFSLLPALTVSAASLPFEDVSPNAWYYTDVERAYESGLFVGVSDTQFDPAGSLKLSHAVTLAARVAQFLSAGEVTLENGSPVWYSTYVDYAKSAGIIGAEYDGRWDAFATRYEMVQIFAAIPGIDTTPVNTIDDNAIPDVKTSDAFARSVYAFYRAGILTGSDGNAFFGNSEISRCEVAAILSRLLYPDRRQSLTLKMNAVPEKNAPLTEENLLALLDAYDPDGAWIIRSAEGTGLSWSDWLFGASTIGDIGGRLGTAVHEQLHGYTSTAGWRSEYIYIGGGQSILVNYTKVFDTAEMADQIPAGLQSYRYDTYVSSQANVYMASRQFGVYGLLDEYAAYCWGMNNDLKMEAYFGSNPNSYSNTYVAFAEFRYYILSYMLYAKEHYSDIYQGIMENTALLRAFSSIDARFEQLAEQYRAAKPGISRSSFDSEYQALTAAVSAPEYQEMLRLMYP